MIVGASRKKRILAAAVVFGLAPSAAAAAPCYTHSEARSKWPDAHLWWHHGPDDDRCWDTSPHGARHYDERPKMHLQIMPANVADASALEHATPAAKSAEIFYPELVKGSGLDVYPILVWPQNWLNPDGAHNWPKLIDIDRVPFGAWDKRIGQ